LFLKNKDKHNFLLTCHPSSNFKFNFIETFLKTKGIRQAEEKDLQEKLGVEAGSVTPLALANDAKKEVKYLFDKASVFP